MNVNLVLEALLVWANNISDQSFINKTIVRVYRLEACSCYHVLVQLPLLVEGFPKVPFQLFVVGYAASGVGGGTRSRSNILSHGYPRLMLIVVEMGGGRAVGYYI